LYSVDTAADATATSKILNSDVPEAISLLKTVLEAFQKRPGPAPRPPRPVPPAPKKEGIFPAPLDYDYPEKKER